MSDSQPFASVELAQARQQLPRPPERRRIRIGAGLTQQAIGTDLGVTGAAVAHWEAGGTPGARHVVAYVDLLTRLRELAQVS